MSGFTSGKPIGVIEVAIDISDIVARSAHGVRVFSVVASLAVLLGLIVSLLLARNIGSPIRKMTATMRKLAGGDNSIEVPAMGRKDEIGQMAQAVASFKDAAIEKVRLEAETAKLTRASAQAEADAAELARAAAEAQAERARRDAELARTVEKVVAALGEGLERLAQGDLTCRLPGEFAADYKKTQDDFNSAIDKLQETIGAIASSARQVTSAAAEISTSTTDLSQRTEEQAASLEETSASMEQMAATVKKNAENAQQANQLSSNTRDIANRGGEVVANTVKAMARIEESSRKIADILGVIDEIARQTNLLALNAAVEAARAGDAGRGFAVVASEVRALAQRSSQAAKDIKDLISNSSSEVKEGVELVNRAGTSLAEITASIKLVADLVADIAKASIEQTSGIEQINKALSQMDGVTQQNTALVEENAAAAKTLEDQSEAMDERIRFFRTGSPLETEATPPAQGSRRSQVRAAG